MKRSYWYLLGVLLFSSVLLDATSLIFKNKTNKTIWIRRVFSGGIFKSHKKGPGEATKLGHGESVLYKPVGMLDGILSTRGWQYSTDGNKWSSTKVLTPIKVPGKLYGKSLVAVPSGKVRIVTLGYNKKIVVSGFEVFDEKDKSWKKYLIDQAAWIVTKVEPPAKFSGRYFGKFYSNALVPFYHTSGRNMGLDAFSKQEVKIRFGSQVASKGEKRALEEREKRIEKNQEKFLGIKFDSKEKPLSIAFVGSGGGVRARMSTTGFVVGASDIGLFDCVTYFSALSGSTWMLAPWIMRKEGIDIKEFKKIVIKDCQKDFSRATFFSAAKKAIKVFKEGSYYTYWKRPFGIVNIFGSILPTLFLKDVIADPKKKHECFLGDASLRVEKGSSVIPIFEARVFKPKSKDQRDICCFTPWEFGSRFFCNNGAHIPIWSFGRKFKNCVSTDKSPRPLLGFLMGIWGSAFTARVGQILGENEELIEDWKKKSIAKSEVNNFLYKCNKCSDYKELNKMDLFDSGININIPVLSVYRRPKDNARGIKEGSPSDVIVIFDASGGEICEQIIKAKKEIESKGLPFPVIPSNIEEIQKGAKSKGLLVYDRNPNPKKYKDWEIPTVIYMSLKSFFPEAGTKMYSTFKFKYDEKEANNIMNATEKYIKDRKVAIKEVLKKRRALNAVRFISAKINDDMILLISEDKPLLSSIFNAIKKVVFEIPEAKDLLRKYIKEEKDKADKGGVAKIIKIWREILKYTEKIVGMTETVYPGEYLQKK